MSQIATPREKIRFFQNQSTTGVTSPAMRVFGGYYGYHIEGTLGGASVQLYILGDDGVTWQVFGAARTTNDAGNTPANSATPVLIAGPVQMQAAITGGAPSGVYVSLGLIP